MRSEQEILDMIETCKSQEIDSASGDAGKTSAKIQRWALEWVLND